jgi:hypothetical protein
LAHFATASEEVVRLVNKVSLDLSFLYRKAVMLTNPARLCRPGLHAADDHDAGGNKKLVAVAEPDPGNLHGGRA